ncbi:MAG TPA: tetratricopeptide repeat protein, partial [Planctomycetota bacterium]|nr:tetratricopeptide repeat protein [Planctomycetota bacterium]
GAERAYHKAIELQPGYAKPHNGLGFLYLELGRLDDAKVAFERAIAIDPQFPDALTNLSLAHTRTGDFAEALPYAERAVAIQPKNPSYLLNLAIPAIRLGRTDQARATTADLVQVAAGNAPAWCERTWALLLAPAQVSEAGNAAARAVELAKGSQMALAQLAAASAAVAAGDAEAARTHLRQFEECNQEVREWEAAKVDDVRNWLQSR